MMDCEDGNLLAVKLLAAEFGTKAVVEARDNRGLTCLFESIYSARQTDSDNSDLVSYLLQHGADPNEKDWDGWSPLSYATATCQLSHVKTLLAYGADAKADGSHALHSLECRKHLLYYEDDEYHEQDAQEDEQNIARLLLEHCAEPDAKKPGREWTPFMKAVANVKIGMIREMAVWMESVPDVERKDIAAGYQNRYNDIMEAINEGKNERTSAARNRCVLAPRF